MTETLHQRIADVLSKIRNPRTGHDIVRDQMVRDVATTTSGKVRLTLLLDAADPATLVRDVRVALERIEGVSDVYVDVKDPANAAAAAPKSRALPVMDDRPAKPRADAPTPVTYPNLGRIVAVSSGKGGVGKSTVATNLAVALAKAGHRVGLMDADIYGPNLPRMMGVNEQPSVLSEKIIPLEAFGVKLMSLGFMIDRDQPAIWRGPIVMKIITQFLRDVAWGQLDYFIVDMPPGTGDAQLSLVQATMLSGAVIVTTPQEMSTGDALRGVRMFQRVGVPVLGIVENMSWFECPHCGKPTAIFGSGGGQRLATETELPLLGQIPLYPRMMEGAEIGQPIVVADAPSPAAKALFAMTERVIEALRELATAT